MSKQYSTEFKEQAVKRVLAGESSAKVARGLGINVNSLYSWKSRYREHPEQPFVGSGNLRDVDAELRKLQKEIRDLREENEFLKKASAFFAKNLKQPDICTSKPTVPDIRWQRWRSG